ncbi:trimeric intracellular cation channel family protein [Roseateles oligotrophus]|uniref:Trimeric intracellular cation channel family protein n=1 Tax=Roseateles oligotrophus TaxID=1769250 RepID=A0ABT2YEW0_9BURK|nr:trimeric intracellular cation channel family protein [Roseateles oligotrophus]MCV2368567.1 trimeric intracellular cation channel family protein [Roseateles oligotrophus]
MSNSPNESLTPKARIVLYWMDLAGVAVFAISGALAAMQSRLDLFGVLVLAAITAIGGGTLRDLLLGRHPIFWMRDTRYIKVIALTAMLTALAASGWGQVLQSGNGALVIADTLGLALFALCGAEIAEEAGKPRLVVVLLGTITASGGGVLRDLLTGQVPLLLRRDIYASAAIGGIAAYLLLRALGLPRQVAFIAGMLMVVALRLAALHFGWQLPAPQLSQ